MPSETVPTAPDVPTASAVPPLKLNKYKFQRERLPIKKLDYAIEEVNEMLQATNIQMNKIRHIANHGGYTFNSLAGDLITQTADIQQNLVQLEKRRSSFGVMKYIHFGKEPAVLLQQCSHTLISAQSVSETALRIFETSQNLAGPRGTSSQSSNPPDRPCDDEDCASVRPTSRSNAADHSPPPHSIVINGHATLHFHHCHTTVRNISLASPSADGFTLNCHTTASRGSEHNSKMQFPPTSASEAPAAESATPGSGV